MSLTRQQEKILATVESLREDILDLTMDLVKQPSTVEHQAGAVAVMAAHLEALGYPPVRIPVDKQKLAAHPGYAPVPFSYAGSDNLVAVRPADGKDGRSALFNGHLDVVSATPEAAWSRDPYEPVISDGWLYGRGSGDMKSGVAAMTYAVKSIDIAGFGLNAPVTIETVVDEECCGNGALSCLLAGYDADAVLIPEPFGPTLNTAQVGVLWFKIQVKGLPVHVLSAPAGTNAIEKSFPLIQALRKVEEQLNTENIPAKYRDIPHPLNLNVGIFSAGDWPTESGRTAEHGKYPRQVPGYSPSSEPECRNFFRRRLAINRAGPSRNSLPPVLFSGNQLHGNCRTHSGGYRPSRRRGRLAAGISADGVLLRLPLRRPYRFGSTAGLANPRQLSPRPERRIPPGIYFDLHHGLARLSSFRSQSKYLFRAHCPLDPWC